MSRKSERTVVERLEHPHSLNRTNPSSRRQSYKPPPRYTYATTRIPTDRRDEPPSCVPDETRMADRPRHGNMTRPTQSVDADHQRPLGHERTGLPATQPKQ